MSFWEICCRTLFPAGHILQPGVTACSLLLSCLAVHLLVLTTPAVHALSLASAILAALAQPAAHLSLHLGWTCLTLIRHLIMRCTEQQRAAQVAPQGHAGFRGWEQPPMPTAFHGCQLAG